MPFSKSCKSIFPWTAPQFLHPLVATSSTFYHHYRPVLRSHSGHYSWRTRCDRNGEQDGQTQSRGQGLGQGMGSTAHPQKSYVFLHDFVCFLTNSFHHVPFSQLQCNPQPQKQAFMLVFGVLNIIWLPLPCPNPENEHKFSFLGFCLSRAATTPQFPKMSLHAHFLSSGHCLALATIPQFLKKSLRTHFLSSGHHLTECLQPQKWALALVFGVLPCLWLATTSVWFGLGSGGKFSTWSDPGL